MAERVISPMCGAACRPAGPAVVLLSLALLAAGCDMPQQMPRRPDLTFERGVQMLVAGSPRSAIPFFQELIVIEPDGPEPHAMLALAFALDQQPERAIEQAEMVCRDPRRGESPGWELIALGVAAMDQQRDDDAVAIFAQAVKLNPDVNTPLGAAADQWLTLALLLKGETEQAADRLRATASAARLPSVRTTARLWAVLALGSANRSQPAAALLAELPGNSGSARRLELLRNIDPDTAQPRDVLEAAMAAIACSDRPRAESLLTGLNQRMPNACDADSWLALLAAAAGRTDECRQRLRAGCEAGPRSSRALANQLYSVVSAIDGRADLMVQHLLLGHRLTASNRFPMQTPRQPDRDQVWMSDRLK